MEKMKTKTNEGTQIITMTGLPHDFRREDEVQVQTEDQNLLRLWNGLENVIRQMKRVTMKMNKEQNEILGEIVWLVNEVQGRNQLIHEWAIVEVQVRLNLRDQGEIQSGQIEVNGVFHWSLIEVQHLIDQKVSFS